MADTNLLSGGSSGALVGYGALTLHALASGALDHTMSTLAPSLGNTFTVAASVLGASAFALPFYVFRTFIVCFLARNRM
jgi:solute carrier family 30 (zinc transporter), member 5/7